jgi:sulfite oxidase
MSSTSRVDQTIYEDGDVLCHWDLPKKVKNKLKFPHEPERPNKQYIVRGECPFNAEPPLRQLVEEYITDKDVFFKRNHGPIPLIDESTHKVSVSGIVPKPFDLSMDAIKNNYSKLRILAALQVSLFY